MTPELLWPPSTALAFLQQRAALIAKIRQFFNKRRYLEVETPIMAQFGVSDVYLSNIPASFRGQSYYLQTSPEYHMKRLLAAGSGPIFQLSKVFRDDELGRWHNPEFTMLEWYQLDVDHHWLIDEVEALLQELLQCGSLIRKSYQQVFLEISALDPFTASIEELQNLLKRHQLDKVLAPDEKDRDQYLFLLMSHVIEPALSQEVVPVVVDAFPPSQASLAKIEEGRASRFEVYYRGVELANGFHELTDAKLQAQRFAEDLQKRRELGFAETPADRYLLAALEHGLPPRSGVALGVDRLLALALKQDSIKPLLAFDFERA